MSKLQSWISLAFLLLTLGLAAVVVGYWHIALEPGLRQEAQNQADLMAQAQAERLAERLVEAQRQQQPNLVRGALDEILSFTDRSSDTPFFARVELELDPGTQRPSIGTDYHQAGEQDCHSCFRAETSLLDPRDFHLIGIGRFWVNDRLYQQLRLDFRRHLLIQSVVGGTLLLLAWIAVLILTQQIQRQSARRQQAERALMQNQARYQRLLDSLSGYFVYARSVDGRISFVSESAHKVLGHTPEALCRHFPDLLIDAPGSGGFPETPGAAGSNTVRLALRGRDGRIRHLECSETRRPDAFNDDDAIEGIARDVSAQQALEETLREAKEQAERANRAKSAFLANVSHEIRTPMAGIVGLTRLLLKHDADPRAPEHLRQILASGQSLLAILNDILDISKMEAGKVALEQEPFDLESVLEQMVSLTAIKAEEKGLELVLATGPGIPRTLRGDATRLGQILLNLTNNAIKFTTQGHVLLCVECLRHTAVGVALRFAVEDSGIGIARKDLRRLFEPFTQLDEPHDRRDGGTGLGLAISRHLVEQMESRLAVDSTPGHGSVFSFTADFALPTAGPPALLSAPKPDSTPGARHGISVLLADDHPLAQGALAELLTESGYQVALAESAPQVLSMLAHACARGHPFRVLLLDADIKPDIPRRIRDSDAVHPSPAIVLMSGYGTQAGSEHGARIDAHLLKPTHRTALLEAMATALAQPAAEPPADEVAAAEVAAPIPVAPVAPVPTDPIPTAVFAPGTRVLLAEDHAANRAIAVELLEGLGLEVEAVGDGFAVLERLERSNDFAAVLMDIQMPGLGGIEATQRLRADPRYAALPVIAVTAYAMIGDAERFRSAGMTGYLSKPLDEAQLLEVLRLWLPLDGSPAAAPQGAVARFPQEHQHSLAEIREALVQGYAADAIAIAHRLRTAAADINATAIAEAAYSLQLAIARKMPTEEPLRQLEAALAAVLKEP